MPELELVRRAALDVEPAPKAARDRARAELFTRIAAQERAHGTRPRPARRGRPGRRRHRGWHWRRGRLAPAAALAVATAIVGVALTALPGPSLTPEATRGPTGLALLRTASAAAANQPAPPASGYRYAEVLNRWRAPLEPADEPEGGTAEAVEIEQRVETWVGRDDWSGRRLAHRGRVLAGDPKTGSARACDDETGDRPTPLPARCEYYHLLAPSEGAWGYGGEGEAIGPIQQNVDVARLPTEAEELRRTLLRAYRSENWAPGHPTREQERYDLVQEVCILLEQANTTPDLRAALWGVLALTPGAEAAPAARDPLGRSGEAVTMPGPNGGVITIVFDPDTSELLFWSDQGSGDGEPDSSHTVLRAGHVERTGERP